MSEQNKAIEQSLTEAATADPSIVAESQRSDAQIRSVIPQMKPIESVVIIKIPTALS